MAHDRLTREPTIGVVNELTCNGCFECQPVCAYGAVEEDFRPMPTAEAADLLAQHYGVHPPFLLFVSTIEPRKNVEGLLHAFARVAPDLPHDLVLVGGLFVMEALSVIIQVGSFKTTGRRVFRMAPIHHHFEELGWTEPKVVVRFWILSILFALLSLATLKLR